MAGKLEAVVKVTILFLLWPGNFKVDLLCEPCMRKHGDYRSEHGEYMRKHGKSMRTHG